MTSAPSTAIEEALNLLLIKNRATQEILAIVVAKLAREAADPSAWMHDLEQQIATRRAVAMSNPAAEAPHKDFAADVMEDVDSFFRQFR